MTSFLLAALASFSFLGIGTFLARFVRPGASISERFLVGFLAVSFWTTFVGTLGLLSAATAAVPFFALAWGIRALRGDAAIPREDGIFWGILALAATWDLSLAGLPPLGTDALNYHLNLPHQYLLRGAIAVPEENAYYRYTQVFETGILPLVAWDHSGVAANLLNIPILLALVHGAHRLAARNDGAAAGIVAAAAVASAPITTLLILQTKNDLLAAAFLLWGGAVLWEEDDTSPRAAAWGGLLLGGGVAVKVSLAIVVVPLLAALASRGIRRFGAAAIASALPSVFWIGRNWIEIGAPLPPILSQGPAFTFAAWAADLGPRLEEILDSFLRFRIWNIEGPIGILLLLLPLAGLARILPLPRRRPIGLAALAAFALWSVVAWRWWRMGQGQTRLLLPLLYLLLPFGAVAVADKRTSRWAAAAAMLFSLYEGARLTRHRFLHDAPYYLNSYRVQLRSEELPDTSLTLSVGEPRLFYFRRRVAFDGYWERPRLWRWAHEENHDTAALLARLRRAGFTHLLNNPATTEIMIRAGEISSGLCDKDSTTVEALCAALPAVARDPEEPEVALYALDSPAVSSPR